MLDYMLAGGLAWLIAFLIGPFTINMLRRLKAGQTIQKELPAEFQAKAGIPQMGGIIMLVAVTISGLLVTKDKTLIMWLLFLTLGNGLVGLIDDFIIMAMRRSVGLKARHKLLAQFLLALVFALYAYSSQDIGSAIIVPWGTGVLDLGPWFVPLVSVFVIVGMANGVNLADGMDGLAAGTTGIAAIALAVISHMALHTDVATFASALAGACLGFSWFNSHPAQVIMGDTGSLALGAGLAGIAVLTKWGSFSYP